MLRKIPRTMFTQHPDNANVPSWCEGEVIKGDDDVYEAYFAYSSLGCHEVLWDSEGKDADTRVIRKLLDLKAVEEKLGIKLGPKNLAQKKYENIVSNFLISYIERDDEEAKGYLGEAARLRKCLG